MNTLEKIQVKNITEEGVYKPAGTKKDDVLYVIQAQYTTPDDIEAKLRGEKIYTGKYLIGRYRFDGVTAEGLNRYYLPGEYSEVTESKAAEKFLVKTDIELEESLGDTYLVQVTKTYKEKLLEIQELCNSKSNLTAEEILQIIGVVK